MKFSFIVLLTFIFLKSWSQEIKYSIEYFDANGRLVKSKSESKYYRKIEKKGERFIVRDFFSENDILQMEGECSAIRPGPIFDGLVKYFKKNGNPSETYIQNGNELKYIQYWSRTGAPILTNGSGILEESDEFNNIAHFEFKDSAKYLVYTIRGSQKDTIFSKTPEPAEFPGGMKDFYEKIESSLNYPTSAKKKKIEGTVYIGFVINKQGELIDIEIVKGTGSSCDIEAQNCIKNIREIWRPAKYQGNPVKTVMVIPIAFKLGL